MHRWRVSGGLYLEEKMASKKLKPSSAVEYSKRITRVMDLMQLPYEKVIVEEHRRGIRRAGIRPEQALPATFDDVRRAMDYLTEGEAIGLYVAVKAC